MPRAKQLTVWVPDRPGMLGELGTALGQKKINIMGFAGATQGGQGMIWLVVDKPAAAKTVLTQRGWRWTEEEVLVVTLSDTPGSLGRVASKLGRAGVDITFAYAGSAGSARKMNAYFGVPDLKAALKSAIGREYQSGRPYVRRLLEERRTINEKLSSRSSKRLTDSGTALRGISATSPSWTSHVVLAAFARERDEPESSVVKRLAVEPYFRSTLATYLRRANLNVELGDVVDGAHTLFTTYTAEVLDQASESTFCYEACIQQYQAGPDRDRCFDECYESLTPGS